MSSPSPCNYNAKLIKHETQPLTKQGSFTSVQMVHTHTDTHTQTHRHTHTRMTSFAQKIQKSISVLDMTQKKHTLVERTLKTHIFFSALFWLTVLGDIVCWFLVHFWVAHGWRR